MTQHDYTLQTIPGTLKFELVIVIILKMIVLYALRISASYFNNPLLVALKIPVPELL